MYINRKDPQNWEPPCGGVVARDVNKAGSFKAKAKAKSLKAKAKAKARSLKAKAKARDQG